MLAAAVRAAGGNDAATSREGTSGTVVTVIRARDEADSLEIATETCRGRSCGVFTRDVDRGCVLPSAPGPAMTHVNDSPVNDHANAVFPG
jgi:acyl-CoA reductase-like NAD-dependent aldehyde dehydrogenase